MSSHTDIAQVPGHRDTLAKFTPAEWVAAGKASPVGTHDWSKLGSVVENWNRELEANAGLDISQVPHSLVIVAWYWQCENGHRWREPVRSVLAKQTNSLSPAPRWKRVAGAWGACRECTLARFGRRFGLCGHIDPDLGFVANPPAVVDGWCRTCVSSPPELKVGDVTHVPDGAAAAAAGRPAGWEDLRRLLAQQHVPVAGGEVNAVVVDVTQLPAGHVVADVLVPAKRVAVTYDDSSAAALKGAGWDVIRVAGDRSAAGRGDVAWAGSAARSVRDVVAAYRRILAFRDPPE